jgi:GNAT superfamily N-acetyltransferase
MTTTTLEWKPELKRGPIVLDVVETGWSPWFEWARHAHYLRDAKPMPFGTAFTGFHAETGAPVAFLGVAGFVAGSRRVARACRMVVHPEWQGAGVGLRFLNFIAEREYQGEGFIGARVPTLMHTSHPALIAALRRHPDWRQVSQKVVGGAPSTIGNMTIRMNGHLHAVAGFRYKR